MKFIQSLLYPPFCLGCGELIDPSEYEARLCDECLPIWNTLLTYKCPVCRKRISECVCNPRFNVTGIVRGYYALIPYFSYKPRLLTEKELKRRDISEYAVHTVKHICCKAHLKYLAKLLAYNISQKITEDFVLTYPMRDPKRITEYGFDQGRILATYVSKMLDVPLLSVLHHHMSSNEQKRLNYDERGFNAYTSYYVKESDKKKIKGKRFIIIDDVVTSGATTVCCAALLRKNGASEVYCFSIAKTCKHGDFIQDDEENIVQNDGELLTKSSCNNRKKVVKYKKKIKGGSDA